jgi:hypothetical protein
MVNQHTGNPLEFFNKSMEKKKSVGILAQFQQSSIAMFHDINYPSKQ